MSWPFDPTTPHITPEANLDYLCRRTGFTREQLALPPVMVATFQRAAYDRLVGRTAAAIPPALRAVAAAGGSGSSGLSQFLVGALPRGGRSVAVTRLPIGAPATALALESAATRGVRVVLVCGAAGSLQPALPLGSTVVVTQAEREDGTSHHYLPVGDATVGDPALADLLEAAAREVGLTPGRGRSWTIDAPYRETAGAIQRHQASGVAVVEMEAATIFAVAAVRGARAGLIVAVSDELFHPWNPGFHLPVYADALVLAADAVLLAAEQTPTDADEGTTAAGVEPDRAN
jgi:nucleoside phosphorylase